jgi:5-methylcytosine-specific restriction enzyme A
MPRAPFYNRKEWQIARLQALHDVAYACQRCGTSLIGKGRGAIVHHRKELARSHSLRTEPLNLTPLCLACHNSVHADMRRGVKRGCDEDGRPIDPSHPWSKK